MIFTTVTLNPCLDRREYLEGFTLGSTLRPYKTEVSAGGKGINVSKHLLTLIAKRETHLSSRVNTVTFAGGHNGELLKALLEKELWPKEAVHGVTVLPSSFETRICTKLVTSEGVTEINEEGRLSDREITLLLEVLADILAMGKEQAVYLCGSFPQGVETVVENSLITLLESCGIPVVVDTSGKALVESLVASPSLIKPNEDELVALHGGDFESEEQLVDFCRTLYVDNDTEILVTLGEKGAIFVGKEGVFKSPSTPIFGCDPTGAGDAFLAAFTYMRYAAHTSVEESLALAESYVQELLRKTLSEK